MTRAKRANPESEQNKPAGAEPRGEYLGARSKYKTADLRTDDAHDVKVNRCTFESVAL